MSKVKDYFKDTKGEMKHVVWPSRMQTISYTIVVIVLSVFIGYFLGFFDYIFSRGLEKLIGF